MKGTRFLQKCFPGENGIQVSDDQLSDSGFFCQAGCQFRGKMGLPFRPRGSREKPVYYVGYNQVMSEVTLTTSLVTTRINWEPYVLSAVEAVIRQKAIETVVPGKVHGTDMSAGFDRGWVEMLELNQQLAATGTREAMDSAIEQFRRGNGGMVFRGDYTGVDPDNPLDTCDLREGYEENATSSFPTFHYILKDIIFIDP